MYSYKNWIETSLKPQLMNETNSFEVSKKRSDVYERGHCVTYLLWKPPFPSWLTRFTFLLCISVFIVEFSAVGNWLEMWYQFALTITGHRRIASWLDRHTFLKIKYKNLSICIHIYWKMSDQKRFEILSGRNWMIDRFFVT